MEKKVKLVCVIVGIFGALATTAGFVAEAKRVKKHQIRMEPEYGCMYPRSPALALGLTAAVALAIAQTIINVATGCLCCRERTFPLDLKQTVAVVCSTVSWFTFIVAFLLLVFTAILNDKKGEESGYFGDFYCYAVNNGLFALASVLSFASVSLGILSYVLEESAKNRGDPWSQSVAPEGIAMGPPQRSQDDAVFVQEDVYLRRQIV